MRNPNCAGELVSFTSPVQVSCPARGIVRRAEIAHTWRAAGGSAVSSASGMAASSYTTLDTAGCNASQIAAAYRLGKSHWDHGLSRGVLNAWIRRVQR